MIHSDASGGKFGVYLTVGPFLLHLNFTYQVPDEYLAYIMNHFAKFLVAPEQIAPKTTIHETSVYPDNPPPDGLNGRTVMVLDGAMRIWAARQARISGGFMCHSAGIINRGRGWLLPGRSGAGKSTLAYKLAPHCDMVLSDEVCIVLPGDGGWRLWGTPFYGTGEQGITGPGSPLQALLFPHRARALEITNIDKNEALPRLLQAVVIPNNEADAAVLDAAIAMLESCRTLDAAFAYRSTPQEVYHAITAALSS